MARSPTRFNPSLCRGADSPGPSLRLSGQYDDRGLQGSGEFNDPNGSLPGIPIISPQSPWPVELWFGAWDADALSGFMEGYMGVPLQVQQQDRTVEFAQDLAAVISDPL